MTRRTRSPDRVVVPRLEDVRPATLWPWIVSTLSAVLVLGPGLAPGFVLVRDMVFVPSPALSPRLLGIGHETPRAVPSDLVVALLSQVVPGQVVQKTLLAGVLVAAGVGAARLVPRAALPGSAAALVAVWNPYVGERLLMGQWALLVGYGACAWVVLGVARVARGQRGAIPLATGLVIGSLGGAAAWVVLVLSMLGAVAGVAVVSRIPRAVFGRVAPWLLLPVALALPWAVPALLRPGGLGSAPAGFTVFAPGSDTVLGAVGSLLTGGGTWNTSAVPPGRGSMVAAVAALLLLAWAVAGFLLTRRGPVRERYQAAGAVRAAVVGAALAGLLVAVASLGGSALEGLATVPGGGLLRDGSRELAPWVLLVAAGAGWGAAWLAATGLPKAAAGLVALLPVVALPGLGWGVSGALSSTDYPSGVLAVAAAADRAPSAGTVVVLPFETVRRYPWNGARPSLTPWPRLLERRVVVSSDLVVATSSGLRTVAGEDRYAADVRRALDDPAPAQALTRLGVGWVITDSPDARVPPGSVPVAAQREAGLYRLPGQVTDERRVRERYDPPALPVVLGDVTALLAAAAALVLVRPMRRGSRRTATPGRTIG